MHADILIVGQGLAGTLLAWEFERAGIPFTIVDTGHAAAATLAAAGIINPITGRRLVKSWRIDSLLPAARAAYREIEAVLGVPLWHEMRVRRRFADERERAVWHDKHARGELQPYGGAGDEDGFWIEGAARVDLPRLLAAARARWETSGRLRTETSDGARATERHELVIDCTGRATALAREFSFVPWEFSHGEVLELDVKGAPLEPDVILNRRHWVVPTGPATALVGATHEPGKREPGPTAAGRAVLEASARELLGEARTWTVRVQRAGLRVNLPDKHPVAGRHPANPRLGLVNGLGAKGALWAPMLARQWVNHLTEGVPFDAAVDMRRFESRLGSSNQIER